MLGLTSATRIYLCRGFCDMRQPFDCLCGMICAEPGVYPLSGSLFVFVNHRSMVQMLYRHRRGLVLW